MKLSVRGNPEEYLKQVFIVYFNIPLLHVNKLYATGYLNFFMYGNTSILTTLESIEEIISPCKQLIKQLRTVKLLQYTTGSILRYCFNTNLP